MWASEARFDAHRWGEMPRRKGPSQDGAARLRFAGRCASEPKLLGVRTHAGTLVGLVKQARRGSRWVRERTCRDVGCTCRRRASTDAMITSAWEAVRPKRAKCESEIEADARRPGSLVRVALTRRTAAVLARRSSVPGGRGFGRAAKAAEEMLPERRWRDRGRQSPRTRECPRGGSCHGEEQWHPRRVRPCERPGPVRGNRRSRREVRFAHPHGRRA
jgi:hypothetical protein